MKWITIDFVEKLASGKTNIYRVCAKGGGGKLGIVLWYAPWRKYIFQPTLLSATVFEWDCLRDISDFCETATQEHKRAKNETNQGRP